MSDETMTEVEATNVTEASDSKEEKKESKPRVTFKEKFADNTSEEERFELAQKVAELRIDPDATRAMSWKKIREHDDVILSSDEFHKIIRPSDYYEGVMLGRLNSLIDSGWVYNGSLHTLCGFDVPEEVIEKMEANQAKAKAKVDKKAADAKAEKVAEGKEPVESSDGVEESAV